MCVYVCVRRHQPPTLKIDCAKETSQYPDNVLLFVDAQFEYLFRSVCETKLKQLCSYSSNQIPDCESPFFVAILVTFFRLFNHCLYYKSGCKARVINKEG